MATAKRMAEPAGVNILGYSFGASNFFVKNDTKFIDSEPLKAYNIPVSVLYDNDVLKECGTCSKCLKYCIENNKYLTLSKKERKLLSV